MSENRLLNDTRFIKSGFIEVENQKKTRFLQFYDFFLQQQSNLSKAK